MGEVERRFLNALRTVFCKIVTKTLPKMERKTTTKISSVYEVFTS